MLTWEYTIFGALFFSVPAEETGTVLLFNF